PDPTAGVLYDLGAHVVDQTLLLIGTPESVTARVTRLSPATVNGDWLRITLTYPPSAQKPTRVTTHLEVDSLNAAPAPRCHVRGRDATYEKFGLDPQEAALREGQMPGAPGWGEEPEENWGTLYGPEGKRERVPTLPGDYGAFYRALYTSLARDVPPPVDPRDALLQLEILESARPA